MKIFKELSGSVLIIGNIDESYLGKNITEVYYMNSNDFKTNEIDNNMLDVEKNIHLKNLHKCFKNGIDNICANYNEIKDYYPAFIRESLKITKKEIYIIFMNKNDYEFILKKFKKYNLEIEKQESDYLVMKVKVNKTNYLVREFYYILNSLEKFYNYVSNNI